MSVLSVELLVPIVICFLLLVAANLLQRRIRAESHPWHPWLRYVRISKYVLSWYIISISFTLCNKWVLRYWHGDGFPFPIFVTAMHMTIKFCLTRVINRCCIRPERRVRPLPLWTSLRGPIPIGVLTGVDVVLSNLSFMFISVTFYTILKSGALIWILIWAVIMRLEPLTMEIVAICVLVSMGVSLASYGEASFSLVGFILVTAACASSGLRWALTQVMLEGKGGLGSDRQEVLHRSTLVNQLGEGEWDVDEEEDEFRGNDGHNGLQGNGGGSSRGEVRGRDHQPEQHRRRQSTAHHPPSDQDGGSATIDASLLPPMPAPSVHHPRAFEILYHVSPASALSCVTVFLMVELQPCLRSPVFHDGASLSQLLVILILGGLISFLLVLAEVKLVKISSSLTMSMFGAVKEIITVALSMMVFHDDVSPLNVSGLLLAIVGAVWYRQYKQKPGSSLSIYLSSAGEAGGEGSSSVGGMRTPTTESGIFHLNEFSSDEEEEEEDDDRAVGRVPGDEEAVEVEMYNISRAQLA
ncbi:solute carrier family 35 member c2 [Nannochloropsis oceanica]